jgi:probable F420-dependent oxidoreductase
MYWRTHDQYVALAAVAAATSTLRIGTGITLVAQRDPIWLAKEVASLDVISNGRLLFGIGYGWNKEEMAHHGVAYRDRRAVLRENVLAMRRIWTEEEASFEGEHVRFDASWSWPKPVQQPHPPIILGGDAGPRTMGDIVEFCDGWMPLGGRHQVTEKIAELRSVADTAGRDPDSIEIGVFGAPRYPAGLEGLAEAGVSRAVLTVPPAEPDAVIAKLDECVRIAAAFIG